MSYGIDSGIMKSAIIRANFSFICKMRLKILGQKFTQWVVSLIHKTLYYLSYEHVVELQTVRVMSSQENEPELYSGLIILNPLSHLVARYRTP